MSDSRGGGQKMAMPVRIQAAMSRLMWFHMLSKDLLRSELEVTVSYCGKELDAFCQCHDAFWQTN